MTDQRDVTSRQILIKIIPVIWLFANLNLRKKMTKLLFVVTEDWYFCSHRLSLAKSIKEKGLK